MVQNSASTIIPISTLRLVFIGFPPYPAHAVRFLFIFFAIKGGYCSGKTGWFPFIPINAEPFRMVLILKPGDNTQIKIPMEMPGEMADPAVPDPFGAHNYMIRMGIVRHVPGLSGEIKIRIVHHAGFFYSTVQP
jgi:hypothetical protein